MEIADLLLETEAGQMMLLTFLLILTHLIIKRFLASLIHRAVRAHSSEAPHIEQKREDTLVNILGTTLSVVIWIIAILGFLAIWHVNIAGLLTGAGVIGVIFGLGGQSVIKDVLAGVSILVENQYRVGDIITLGEVSGVVEKITLRITKLRDLDGSLHIVPNGSVSVVTNRTFGWSNVNLDIGVSYNSDIDKVQKVINETGSAMSADNYWQDHIVEPIVFLRVDNFGDSAVIVKALGRVVPGMQWDVAGEFRARLKKAFEKDGIEIPFPQRVIHQATKKS